MLVTPVPFLSPSKHARLPGLRMFSPELWFPLSDPGSRATLCPVSSHPPALDFPPWPRLPWEGGAHSAL